MKPETRAKNDKLSIVAAASEGRLRILSSPATELLQLAALGYRQGHFRPGPQSRAASISEPHRQGGGDRQPSRPHHHRFHGGQRKASGGPAQSGVRDLVWLPTRQETLNKQLCDWTLAHEA
jgi:hypothetical protein